jgi:hypothetical protein
MKHVGLCFGKICKRDRAEEQPHLCNKQPKKTTHNHETIPILLRLKTLMTPEA